MSKAERVKKIIAVQLGIEESTVTPEKHLVNDLGADSLDEVEIVMYLEDEFGLADIPEAEAEALKTAAAELVTTHAAALSQPAAAEWQPIETAPKDKTVILTFGLGHGHGRAAFHVDEKPWPMMAIAHWDWHEGEREVPLENGLYTKEPCRELEFWRTEWSYGPTHWMPLPSAPTEATP